MSASGNDHHDLFAAAASGTATETDRECLAQLLREDDAALAAFVRYMDLHAALRREIAHGSEAPAVPAPEPIPIYRKGCEPKPHRSRVPFTIAAALLLACGVAIYVLSVNTEPSSPDRSAATIATLIESTGTVIVNNGIGNPGHEYAAGDYAIASGTAQFLLSNRVTVDMHGATRLRMRNNMNAALDHGAAVFRCPPGAEGYTVRLPGGERVVDLGTAFSVRTDDHGRAWLSVIEGLVDLRVDEHESHELERWQSAWRDEAGTWHRAATPPRVDRLALWFDADSDVRADAKGRVIRCERSPWLVNAGDDAVALSRLANRGAPRIAEVNAGGRVLRFGGSDGPLVTPSLTLGESQTIVVVFNDRATDAKARQIVNLNGPPHVVLETIGSPRRLGVRLWDGLTTVDAMQSPPLTRGGRTVAIVRLDEVSERMHLWIDGVARGEAPIPFPMGQTSAKAIGAHPDSPGSGFLGDIARVMIYDAALDDDEIARLHATLLPADHERSGETRNETNENAPPSKETPR